MTFRILYIVGNGFDLGLGLRTDYKSFLKWYLGEQSESNSAAVLAMRKSMCADSFRDFKTWADMEKAFCSLPFSTYGQDIRQVYRDCHGEITGALYRYLRMEEVKTRRWESSAHFARVQQILGRSLLRVFYDQDCFVYPWALSGFQRILAPDNQFRVEINIVSLNYTRVLDRLLPQGPFLFHDEDSHCDHAVKINQPIHLHGDSYPESRDYAVFGASYSKDIKDARLQCLARDVGYLVKPMINADKYEQLKLMIDRSNCTVIFGSSCGETDARIWHWLYQKIQKNDGDYKVYYCCYNEGDESNFENFQEEVVKRGFEMVADDSVFGVGYKCIVGSTGEKVVERDPLHLTEIRQMLVEEISQS